MPDDYYKGVGTLAPTDGIKDPQVRAFCDSLANVWQLRNGMTGSDRKQRFITEQEWDFIAQNPNIRALAGIGQPGSSTLEPGPGGDDGLPPWIQNLVDFLKAGITLVDFTQVYKYSNELFASYFAMTTEIRNEFTKIQEEIDKLEDGINDINTITEDSDSESAKAVHALIQRMDDTEAFIIEIEKVEVTDGESRSANANKTRALSARIDGIGEDNLTNSAMILEIENVSATTKSANAKHTYGMEVNLGYNPVTGQSAAVANIAEINKVEVTDGPTTSASANKVRGMSAQVGTNLGMINEIENVSADSKSVNVQYSRGIMAYSGLKARVFAQPNEPVSDSTYTLKPGDLWIRTDEKNKMYIRNTANTAWVDASDARIAEVSSGAITETAARTQSDTALASQLNFLWAQVGNTNSLVWDVGTVYANTGVGEATKFQQVYTNMPKGPDGTPILAASQVYTQSYIDYFQWRASSQWSLIVQAEANNVKAVAGMILSAEVKGYESPGNQAQSAVTFLADAFTIHHPDYRPGDPAKDYRYPPFAVYGGVVRLNTAWIHDRIQSDNFISAFDPYGRPAGGWVIYQNGDSEFHGTSLFAKVYSNSTIVDRYSKQEIYALTTVSGHGQKDWAPGYPPRELVRLVAPQHHAGVLKRNRIRVGSVVMSVTFIGVADHVVSIFMQKNDGAWVPLNATTTPSDNIGAITVGWSDVVEVAYGDYFDFGATATYTDYTYFNGNKLYLEFYSLIVTAVNL